MRKGSKRKLNLEGVCRHCSAVFPCADPKASICQNCKGCKYCGKHTRAMSRTCITCAGKHLSDKRLRHLGLLHKNMCGHNNPAKRPEVREKISKSKRGDLNPARKYIEQYREHIAKYRPGKISKLEQSVAGLFPSMTPQYKVGWYTIDYADVKNKIALEIQGCWHHCCQICFPNSPKHKTQGVTAGNDKRKKKFLQQQGWHIVEICEHEIKQKEDLEGLFNARLS